MKKRYWIGLAAGAALLAACQTSQVKPLSVETKVDLPLFMGDWYVIANIPTYFEKGAHNAVETYKLAEDGTVDIDFNWRADSFDGKAKHMASRGFMADSSNAVWGVQFLWPIKADYRVAYVSPDYKQTIIAREKRDYVWIMSKQPTISETDYQQLLQKVADLGYDTSKVLRVPQRW